MLLHRQKLLLQIAIAACCLVPLIAGFAGILQGTKLLSENISLVEKNINLDNHFRYLSGLLLAIGFGFLSCIPKIEYHKNRIQLLTFIVFIGGLARLAGFFIYGMPSASMQLALGMELVVTPLLCFWQNNLAKKYNS